MSLDTAIEYFQRPEIQQKLINEAYELGINISWMKSRGFVKFIYNADTNTSKYIRIRQLPMNIIMGLHRKIDRCRLQNKFNELRDEELKRYLVIYSCIHHQYGGGFADWFSKELISLTRETKNEIRERAELFHYGPGTPSSSDDESE